MSNINTLQRNIGISFSEDKTASVRFWSPVAESVQIRLGTTDTSLEKKEFGYWELESLSISPGTAYNFVIDGKKVVPDPASLFQPEGVHGVSETFDVNAFKWTDADWKSPELGKYLLYEIHTGTFTEEGTFEGVISKLDYLVDLGITAIEIMPVAQFPGDRNWGYDGVFPFATQNSYGGPAALQNLVNACHEKGLAVVLDVVYNHVGPEGNYFEQSGPYFTEKYHTPWGSAINFDDAWSDGVRNYFIQNVLMWFRDFHIDALRLDAVHAIKDFGVKHLLKEMREEVDLLKKATGKNFNLIVELDLNDHKYINPVSEQGYGMDAQWIDEFHHALRVTAGEPAIGYYADFSGIAHLEKAYRDAYVYDGFYSETRKRTFGGSAKGNAGQQFIVFSQNHDQVGNRMLGERTSTLVSFEMQKLLAAAVLCSPFLPMLFMGEEWAETNPFLFFTSHGDAELIEAVRKGRKDEFKDFHGEGESPDPQAESTFTKSKLSWDLQYKEGHQQLHSYYKTMIGLRKQYAALQNNDREQMMVSADEKTNCLTLIRWEQEQQVLCLMNFSSKVQSMKIPADKPYWKKILDSADPCWNGPAAAPLSVDALKSVTIQPQSILIYTNKYA
jgi:maltooligosyltrehalose trehalohydrolase